MSGHSPVADMKAAVLVGLVCCAVAASQPILAQTGSIPFAAQSLVYNRDGAVQGCGVRLTGGAPSATGASTWFDVSFNVFRRGIALAQSIAYEIRRSAYQGDSRPARVAVQSTWLKVGDGSARLGENTERRETLVYTLVLDDALALFEAVASGRPVSVGIKRWGQPTASVYAGAPELTSETREQIAACLARLAE
jgi:hypothetical protein